MTNNILILGNGKSRLQFKDYIDSFDGAIAGCNNAYKELLSGSLKRLDYLTSDSQELLIEAKRLIPTLQIVDTFPFSTPIPGAITFSIPKKYLVNSGLNMTVYFLSQTNAEIYLLGFDSFDGILSDIYVEGGIRPARLPTWLEYWRRVIKDFGSERIHFVGKELKD